MRQDRGGGEWPWDVAMGGGGGEWPCLYSWGTCPGVGEKVGHVFKIS